MKIIALPDLHGNLSRLRLIGALLAEVNLVLLAGDLTIDGTFSDAVRVVETVRKFNPSLLTIPGNWDAPEVETYLSAEGVNLDRRHILIEGLAFIGIGASLPGPVRSPNEHTDSAFEAYFAEAMAGLEPGIPKILVCHQPPYDTQTDLAQGNFHVGSMAVRRFIEQEQPLICFTGHIHEGIGIDEIGETKIINPGPLSGGNYAYAEVTQEGIHTLEIVLMNP
jgi:Icc-related predicted phosphoesterase